MVLIGERCIPMPECNPEAVLARGGPSVAFLRTLHDDVLWDVFMANTKGEPHVHRNARFLDAIRAELAHRHAPVERGPLCNRCLRGHGEHDELFPYACPTEEAVMQANVRSNVVPIRKASASIGTLGAWRNDA